MGFLHMLWDETLAGPTPETGLGKLRKYDSFSARSSPSMVSSNPNTEGITITRSITILRRAPNPNPNDNHYPILSYDSSSSSSTPSSSSPTTSAPTTPRTPDGDYRRFTRRKFANEAFEHAEPRSSTIDWIVMSALDR